jgi:hypothetical protein
MPAENTLWEYQVRTFGSFFSSIKDEELESILNEWGTEGWEVVSARGIENTNKVTILAKRPLTASVRRRRTIPV